MEQRTVGASGLRVSSVGLGTMMWGRDTDEEQAGEQLSAFLDAGGTLLDTASSFGGGASERVVGKLLRGGVSRRDVVLCSKAGVRVGRGPRTVDTSRAGLLAQLEESLRRLGTDHVDLFVVQAHDPAVPFREVVSTLEDIVRSGRARYVGVAGYDGWQLARAATLAELGSVPLTAAQVEVSVINHAGHVNLQAPAAEVGVGIIGWSALGRGVLTGKYRHGTPPDSRAASDHFGPFVRPYLSGEHARVVEAVVTAAKGLEASAAEVALAWARDRPGIASVIVGARTAAQLDSVLTAGDLELPDAIRQALDEVSATLP